MDTNTLIHCESLEISSKMPNAEPSGTFLHIFVCVCACVSTRPYNLILKLKSVVADPRDKCLNMMSSESVNAISLANVPGVAYYALIHNGGGGPRFFLMPVG